MSVEFVVSVLKSHKSRFRCGSAALAQPNNPMASQQEGHFWGLRKVAPPGLKGQPGQAAAVDLLGSKKAVKSETGDKKRKSGEKSGGDSRVRRPLMKYPRVPVTKTVS